MFETTNQIPVFIEPIPSTKMSTSLASNHATLTQFLDIIAVLVHTHGNLLAAGSLCQRSKDFCHRKNDHQKLWLTVSIFNQLKL